MTVDEIRQIGGRAGRGAGDPGYVGVVPGLNPDVIRDALAGTCDEPDGPMLLVRPDIQALRPAAGGWRELLSDVRSCERYLPRECCLDLGIGADLAAEIADAHEAATGKDASFCLSAPIGEYEDDAATKALVSGLPSLRQTGMWSIPAAPRVALKSDRALVAWGDYGRALEMARWFSRRSRQIDRKALDRAWNGYVDRLSAALSSGEDFLRSCSCCHRSLDWSHPHGMCESCFHGGDLDDY